MCGHPWSAVGRAVLCPTSEFLHCDSCECVCVTPRPPRAPVQASFHGLTVLPVGFEEAGATAEALTVCGRAGGGDSWADLSVGGSDKDGRGRDVRACVPPAAHDESRKGVGPEEEEGEEQHEEHKERHAELVHSGDSEVKVLKCQHCPKR